MRQTFYGLLFPPTCLQILTASYEYIEGFLVAGSSKVAEILKICFGTLKILLPVRRGRKYCLAAVRSSVGSPLLCKVALVRRRALWAALASMQRVRSCRVQRSTIYWLRFIGFDSYMSIRRGVNTLCEIYRTPLERSLPNCQGFWGPPTIFDPPFIRTLFIKYVLWSISDTSHSFCGFPGLGTKPQYPARILTPVVVGSTAHYWSW